MKKRTHEEFLKEIEGRNFIALDKYQTSRIKMLFECKIDKHQWEATPSNVIRGTGCPKCSHKERAEENKKHNVILKTYDTYYDIDISTPTHPDAVMKIDIADWEKLQSMTIGRIYASMSGKLYASTNIPNENGKRKHITVHRLIMDAKEIDHISDELAGLDNRRSNLREVTHSQNTMNRCKASNNKSGITGVAWRKDSKKWRAYIKTKNKRISLGCFTDKQDAIHARKEAEKKIFGEYAYGYNRLVGEEK